MPRNNKIPAHTSRKRRRSAAQREEERKQIESDGGWYLHIRNERIRREQAQHNDKGR